VLSSRRVLVVLAACALGGSFTASARAADSNEPMYPAIGPATNTGFYINASTPPGVDSSRFVAVVQRVLARWGDRFLGFTALGPVEKDNVNVVGFYDLGGDPAGQGTAGQTSTTTSNSSAPGPPVCKTVQTPVARTQVYYEYVRVRRRVAKRKNGKAVRRRGRVVYVYKWVKVRQRRTRPYTDYVSQQKCDPGPPVVTTTYEYDVRLNSRFTVWQTGPAYPSTNQVDIESVLLHELGHVAGLGHTSEPCPTSSPMAASSFSGDWWRSATDYSKTFCKQRNGLARRTADAARPVRQ
jgi:hypothetical protein